MHGILTMIIYDIHGIHGIHDILSKYGILGIYGIYGVLSRYGIHGMYGVLGICGKCGMYGVLGILDVRYTYYSIYIICYDGQPFKTTRKFCEVGTHLMMMSVIPHSYFIPRCHGVYF